MATCGSKDGKRTETAKAVRSRAARTYQLLILVLLLRPFGNLSLAWGMKHLPLIAAADPLAYLRAMLEPYVAIGILLLILALLVRMALLSMADLTYVVPMTAGGYILSTVLARLFLKENVSVAGWVGTLLIFLGTALVGPTVRSATNEQTVQHDSERLK